MKFLILGLLTAGLGLGATHLHGASRSTPATDRCDAQECEILVERTPEGSCLVTCVCPDGRRCTQEIDCQDGPGCTPVPGTRDPIACKRSVCPPR